MKKFATLKLINGLLIRMGFVANFSTEKKQILSLIKKLHPRQTEFPFIRLGPKGDGGYVLPDDLEGIDYCFSPGVGTFSGFELDCVKRNMQVFMADASVEGPAEQNEQFDFIKKYLGILNDDSNITLADWVNSKNISPAKDLLLQMDIEGGEYIVIPGIQEDLMQRFRMIIVEFHGLHRLWDRSFFQVASACFNKILATHHCVHIHPNNAGGVITYGGLELPKAAEFTFLRKDRVKDESYVSVFPNPLDSGNVKHKKDVVLPSVWYR